MLNNLQMLNIDILKILLEKFQKKKLQQNILLEIYLEKQI